MTMQLGKDATINSAIAELRAAGMAWAVSMILPLPVLTATDPARSADVACLYLGLSCAWLATEIHRAGGLARSASAWRARMLAAVIAIAANVIVFLSMGLAAGVKANFPFPLMAALSAIPAIGMMPWLLRRIGNQYAAILVGGMIVLAAKLAACVVARIVYGPDYIGQGYVAADWRTAKLMISLMWTLTTSLSAAMLLADYVAAKR